MLISSSMRTLWGVLLFSSAIAHAQNKYGLQATTFDGYVASAQGSAGHRIHRVRR